MATVHVFCCMKDVTLSDSVLFEFGAGLFLFNRLNVGQIWSERDNVDVGHALASEMPHCTLANLRNCVARYFQSCSVVREDLKPQLIRLHLQRKVRVVYVI